MSLWWGKIPHVHAMLALNGVSSQTGEMSVCATYFLCHGRDFERSWQRLDPVNTWTALKISASRVVRNS